MVMSGFRPKRRWVILGALALLLVGSRVLQRVVYPANNALVPRLESLPQDPTIQVFFNQSEASVYTDPYRQAERYGDDLEQVVITAINQATETVDVAVQALNLPNVADALVRSAQRGVRVRLILEDQYSQWEDAQIDLGAGSAGAVANALQILDRENIARIDDTADGSRGSGLMHHKFVVVDRRLVIVSSANFTLSGVHGDMDNPESRGNANAIVRIEDRAIAQAFTTEFEYMWGDGPAGQPNSQFGLQKPYREAKSFTLTGSPNTRSAALQFSPTSQTQDWNNSVNGLISQYLNRAERSVDIALFVFSEQRIVNQLENRVKNGTVLRALIDRGFIYRSYSEALDMIGVAIPDHRCQIEDNNRPWQTPITTVGTPSLPEGDKLHHKFAVVDDETVIFGSQNWSVAANTQNDETLLVIENPTVAAHFKREFERLYQETTLGESRWLQQKIVESKQRC